MYVEFCNVFKCEIFGGDLIKFMMLFVVKDDEKVLCVIKFLVFV